MDDPLKRIQIINFYWTGKIFEVKFLKEQNKLISINEAKPLPNLLYNLIDKKMNQMVEDLELKFPDIPKSAILWMSETAENWQKSISNYEWELDD